MITSLRVSVWIWAVWFCSILLFARTNQPLIEDPFDVGGGGAVLTRATQEAILVSNPALLPWGGKFLRWIGLKTVVSPGKDSLALTQSLGKGKGGGDSGESTDSFVTSLFGSPIHLGVAQSFSFITNNGGIALFSAFEPDLRAWRTGDPETGAGTPTLNIRNEVYGGALLSFASRVSNFFSLGTTLKYLLVKETTLPVEITDQAAIKTAQTDLTTQQSPASAARGMGADVGSLLFLQGSWIDFRLAATVSNLGGIPLQGDSGTDTEALKQMYNAGLGLTLHTDADAIHFSIDYRDITNAHAEDKFKRIYAGTKIMVRQYIGVSTGIYHGTPTYGAEVDLIIMRLAGAVYTREYGKHPGVDSRTIYVLSFATGAGF